MKEEQKKEMKFAHDFYVKNGDVFAHVKLVVYILFLTCVNKIWEVK